MRSLGAYTAAKHSSQLRLNDRKRQLTVRPPSGKETGEATQVAPASLPPPPARFINQTLFSLQRAAQIQ